MWGGVLTGGYKRGDRIEHYEFSPGGVHTGARCGYSSGAGAHISGH